MTVANLDEGRMPRVRKLLSIGHSYVVALNRRLAHELARLGRGSWEVTVVAPTFFHGARDLRPAFLERVPDEPCELVAMPAHLTRYVHCFFYGRPIRALLSRPWDLVHCWEEPYIVAGGQVAWWVSRRSPVVYLTFQNIGKRYPPPFAWLDRASLARAAGWIGAGQTVMETLRYRPGYRDRPSRMIPPGVDLDLFRPDPEAGAAVLRTLDWSGPGPPVVGYLGRFVREKGLPLLMQVLEGMPCEWRALFVGAGELEGEVRAWAARHKDRVRVCSGVRHDRVPDHLNAMDVLAAPSQTGRRWREQFGRMSIEAFACGVPVVGSDSGEIPHVVGDAGLVVGESDAAGWQRALAELIESPGRRREMAARGLDRVRAHYAWPVIARQTLDFFEEVSAARRP